MTAIANAAEEAGVIKNRNQTTDTTNAPKNGLIFIVEASDSDTQFKNGVVTDAVAKPKNVPANTAPNGTNIMSKGVLPVNQLPTSTAIKAANTAEIGCPEVITSEPAA